ncbi:hypothetical protein JL720_16560 [Aureococcus anophagefferens]|nr:hypothetical protein JL720_16560 [Aureococcus anophagefferens]
MAEVGHVADSAKAAEFARREGSAAFEATRAATVERVIGARGVLAARIASTAAQRDASGGGAARRSPAARGDGCGGDAPGLPHAMELMRREFKATGDDYGAAARAPGPACSSASPTCSGTRRRPAPPRSAARAQNLTAAKAARRRSEVAAGAAYEARRSGARAAASAAAAGREPRGAGGRAPGARRRRGRRRCAAGARPAKTAAARSGACAAANRNVTQRYGACRAADPPSDKRRRLQDNVFSASEFLDYDRGGFAATFDASVFALPGARLLEHWDLRHVGVFNPSVVALRLSGHAAVRLPGRRDALPDPWDARRGDVGWLAEDVRLFAHNAQSPLDSRLIATAVVVHDKSFSDYDQEHFNQSFGVFELVLDVDAKRRPTARYIPCRASTTARRRGPAAVTEVRNAASSTAATIWTSCSSSAPRPRSRNGSSHPDAPGRDALTGYFGKWLHNNVNPLLLKRHGLLLAVGHEHSNERNDEVHRTTSWHTYLHYFLLYNASAPHALLARSPPFCFASLDDPARCDLIQFVSSLSFARPNDDDRRGRGHDLLLGYGINDCRGALDLGCSGSMAEGPASLSAAAFFSACIFAKCAVSRLLDDEDDAGGAAATALGTGGGAAAGLGDASGLLRRWRPRRPRRVVQFRRAPRRRGNLGRREGRRVGQDVSPVCSLK